MTITKQVDLSMYIDILIENCRVADEKEERYVKVDRVDLFEIIDILVEVEKREKEGNQKESAEQTQEEDSDSQKEPENKESFLLCLGEENRAECDTCKHYIFSGTTEMCIENGDRIFTESLGSVDKRRIATSKAWKRLYNTLCMYESTESCAEISKYISRACEILEGHYKNRFGDDKENKKGENVGAKSKILSEE